MLAWPGVAAEVKWHDDLVYTVAGKMFAVACDHSRAIGRLSFKVEDERFLEWTDQPGIIPAPYLARARWVLVEDATQHAPSFIEERLRTAYTLVRAKLTKKAQRELGPAPWEIAGAG